MDFEYWSDAWAAIESVRYGSPTCYSSCCFVVEESVGPMFDPMTTNRFGPKVDLVCYGIWLDMATVSNPDCKSTSTGNI